MVLKQKSPSCKKPTNWWKEYKEQHKVSKKILKYIILKSTNTSFIMLPVRFPKTGLILKTALVIKNKGIVQISLNSKSIIVI